MTLTDGRLRLRPLGPADCDALYAAVMESKEDVGRLEGIARNRLAFGDGHFDSAMYSLLPGDLA